MPVLGVGIDLVGVAGFAEQLASAGSTFTQRTFSRAEQLAAAGPAGAPQHLAGRFAAKEAFIKAFSAAMTGRAPAVADLDWREIEVRQDHWGRPVLQLHGQVGIAVAATLGEITCHLSITHEPAMAGAVVVLESLSR